MKAPLLRSGAAAIPQSHVPPDARVALVTAAGSPAGQAIGLRLALQGASVGLADADRVAAVETAAKKFNCVAVLKGASTLIASPNGRLRVNMKPNDALARGGTGDVLAGLASGLLAQMPERPFDAASLAVYVHGLAGEVARSSKGEIGMRAGDVIDAIPDAFIELASSGRKAFEFTGIPRTGTYNSDP